MPLTEERAERILLEETLGTTPTADMDDEETGYRLAVRRDVKRQRAAGVEIVVPTREPVLED